jgi:hypothetical protein
MAEIKRAGSRPGDAPPPDNDDKSDETTPGTGEQQAAPVALDPATRARFQWESDQVRQIARRMVTDAMRIGRLLLAVRERIKPGQWGAWLEEVSFTEAAARRFMNIACRCADDPSLVTTLEQVKFHLHLSAAYALAAPSAPPEALRQAVEMAKRGETVGKKDAQRLLDATKKKQRQLESAELQKWQRGLAGMERAARRWAAGAIPPGLSEAERAGAARRIQMVEVWLARTRGKLEEPSESAIGGEEKTTPTIH